MVFWTIDPKLTVVLLKTKFSQTHSARITTDCAHEK